ncbi:Hypothetical predicted protein [Paramuricea clavata]|uniref:Uncharacterized protein n=1 Tax=Paramuricea clavata TaxID=317549 RepID=A0A7D9MBW0_PARCT|nr:Hypothetical predicted protein [Paramuricea clavata]
MKHKSANLGEKVTLHPAVPNANNESHIWLLNNCRIGQIQPGQEPVVYDPNYQLMDNGDLKISKMTKQLEGEYERVGDPPIYLRAKDAIVTDVSSTYKAEKIIDVGIQNKWNITCHCDTKCDGNCEAKIDKMTLCFKKPDDDQCTNLANATIVSKPETCEATVTYIQTVQTSRNTDLKYFVKFPQIHVSDFRPGSSREVDSQTFLLSQAPSTEENPTPKSNTVSTITRNPGQKNAEQSLKPTNTLSMTSGVESKYTQPPSISTNNQPTPPPSTKESTHPITNPPAKSNIVSTINLNPGQKTTEHQPSTKINQPTHRKFSCEQTHGDCRTPVIVSIFAAGVVIGIAIAIGSFFIWWYCRRYSSANLNTPCQALQLHAPSTQDLNANAGNVNRLYVLSSENPDARDNAEHTETRE